MTTNLQRKAAEVRARSLSDVRLFLTYICYIHIALNFGVCFLPEGFKFFNFEMAEWALFFTRHPNDILFLREYADTNFSSRYSNVYNFQFKITIIIFIEYFSICLFSGKKLYIIKYKEFYFAENSLFVMGFLVSFTFLAFSSDFGVFDKEHSWFENNPESDTRGFPFGFGVGTLLFCAFLFEFIFLMACGLSENIVSFLLGHREEQ